MSHFVNYDFNEDEGIVEIQAQLPAVETIISEMAGGTRHSTNERWSHLEVYDDLPVYPMDDGYHTGKLGNPNLWADGRLNLSFFRATGLSEGISLTLICGPNEDEVEIKFITRSAITDLLRRHYVPKIEHVTRKDGRIVDEDSDTLVHLNTIRADHDTWRYVVGEQSEPGGPAHTDSANNRFNLDEFAQTQTFDAT